MRQANHSILILLDNAATHTLMEDHSAFSNVMLHFFPPNTTAHLQPCDAGIIHSFKAHYRKILCEHKIDEYELSQINNADIWPINIYHVIQFVNQAWHSVTPQLIQ